MSCSRHIVRNIDGTPQELKVRLAAMHLTGKATQWHHNYMNTRYGLFPSWTDYIIAISVRFCELFDDPLAELVALKQDSDTVVVVYLDKFETARMRLVLPEAHALSIFLANMNPHLLSIPDSLRSRPSPAVLRLLCYTNLLLLTHLPKCIKLPSIPPNTIDPLRPQALLPCYNTTKLQRVPNLASSHATHQKELLANTLIKICKIGD